MPNMNVNGTYVVNVTMATHSKSLSTAGARRRGEPVYRETH